MDVFSPLPSYVSIPYTVALKKTRDNFSKMASRTHFTLHLLSDSRVSDWSTLAYLRERTSELDTGAFLHCKNSKICFVGLSYGIVKTGE